MAGTPGSAARMRPVGAPACGEVSRLPPGPGCREEAVRVALGQRPGCQAGWHLARARTHHPAGGPRAEVPLCAHREV